MLLRQTSQHLKYSHSTDRHLILIIVICNYLLEVELGRYHD